MTHEQRLASLGIVLPPPPKAVATYATFVQHGSLVYTSGHGPLRADGSWLTGKLGATLDIAEGREAARLNALSMLATLRAQLGSLDRIARMIKVLGFVNSTQEFTDHPQVINGFSDLMVQVFGEAGLAARSAVGAPSLPAGIAVEVEAIFALA